MSKGAKDSANPVELGQYIVADPLICHGQPTFKGTRIMVWQVLEDVAAGRSWNFICKRCWGGRIPLEAVSEAIRLAESAFTERNERLPKKTARRPRSLAASAKAAFPDLPESSRLAGSSSAFRFGKSDVR